MAGNEVDPYVVDDLVSIIMPTMGRTEMAVSVVERVHETAGHHNLEFVCVVDRDSDTPGVLCAALLKYQIPFKMVWSPKINGLARSWNRGLRCADGGILVFFADDLIPRGKWLDVALKALYDELDGYGLVGFNDLGRWGWKETTHYLASRRFVVEGLNGCMGFEHYNFACNDSEACRRAVLQGCYKWERDAAVERLLIMDETKLTHFDDELGQQDIQHMRRREQAGFPNDFAPAIVR